MPLPDRGLQKDFRDRIVHVEANVRAFYDTALRLEQLTLHSFLRGEECGAAHQFPSHEEFWRLKYLLLDLVYGEPTTLMFRTSWDLTSPKGKLNPVWSWAQRLPTTDTLMFSLHTPEKLEHVFNEYLETTFRPRHQNCISLWCSPTSEDISLLSDEARDALFSATGRLHELDNALQAAERSCHALTG